MVFHQSGLLQYWVVALFYPIIQEQTSQPTFAKHSLTPTLQLKQAVFLYQSVLENYYFLTFSSSQDDCKSKKFVEGISCKNCYGKISDKKKCGLKERNKQIQISKKKGLYNPYIKFSPTDF